MTTLVEAVLSQAVLRAVGWAIVHSLWQGALVALAFACVSTLAKNACAHVRYVCACVALALMLLLTVATACTGGAPARGLFAREEAPSEWSWTYSSGEHAGAERGVKSDASPAPQTARGATASPASTLGEWAGHRLASLVPWLAVLWLAGVLLLASRMVGGWLLV